MHASDSPARNWRRTARSRVKMELAGVAFARQHGLAPEDYARHLWSQGAVAWMGKAAPTAAEYLAREAQAFLRLYPEVQFTIRELTEERAELTFLKGTCLGGWGKDQWHLARSLGLAKGHVCRYCRESFRVWGCQLGLVGCPEPQVGDVCIFRVERKSNR